MTISWPSLSEIESPRIRSTLLVAGCTLGCCGLAVLYYWDPSGSSFPLCPLRAFTGLYCPGCGMTRGLHQLLHGNVAAALAYNPLIVLIVPIVLYWLLSEIVLVGWKRELPRPRPTARQLWIVLVVVIAFGVLRNIPSYPFTLLAPHQIPSSTQTQRVVSPWAVPHGSQSLTHASAVQS